MVSHGEDVHSVAADSRAQSLKVCDMNDQSWVWCRGGRRTSVCPLSEDGMKPKMEEALASHSEPKRHESDLISL